MEENNLTTEEKAACWDNLINCSRVRLLGYAREDNRGKSGKLHHIGFEFWKTHPQVDDKNARNMLTSFAKGE